MRPIALRGGCRRRARAARRVRTPLRIGRRYTTLVKRHEKNSLTVRRGSHSGATPEARGRSVSRAATTSSRWCSASQALASAASIARVRSSPARLAIQAAFGLRAGCAAPGAISKHALAPEDRAQLAAGDCRGAGERGNAGSRGAHHMVRVGAALGRSCAAACCTMRADSAPAAAARGAGCHARSSARVARWRRRRSRERRARARGRGRESRQGRIPVRRLARAAFAAERDPRLESHSRHQARRRCGSHGRDAAHRAQRQSPAQDGERSAGSRPHRHGQARITPRRCDCPQPSAVAVDAARPAAAAKGLRSVADIQQRERRP